MTGTEEPTEPRPLTFALACRLLADASKAQHTAHTPHPPRQPAPAPSAAETARTGTGAPPAAHRQAAPAPSAPAAARPAAETARTGTGAPPAAHRQGQEHGPRRARPLPDGPHDGVRRPGQPGGPPLAAALAVLDRLSPLERAVLILREAFGCAVSDIASAVGCSPAACRQLLASLAVTTAGDGGRGPLPWPRHVEGAADAARLLAAIVPPLARIGVTWEERPVDGRPGSLFRDRDGRVLSTLELAAREPFRLLIRPARGPGAPRRDARCDGPAAEAGAAPREADRTG